MTGGMTRHQRYALVLLRLGLGSMFLYAGVTKLMDPEWSAAGYLAGAKTFSVFYQWLASPSILPITNALNAWGLTIIGVTLILGIAVRFASWVGVLLMFLYYLPVLEFPYVNEHSYLVDEHVIYALGLIVLSVFHAGRVWGFGHFLARFPMPRRFRHVLTQ